MTTTTGSKVALKILLPEDVYDSYERLAEETDTPVHDLLVERVSRFSDRRDRKPLYFGDEERRTLEELIGVNVDSPARALLEIRRMTTMRVNNARVQLKPQLIQRLKSRCFGMEFPDFVRDVVTKELERYCNMR